MYRGDEKIAVANDGDLGAIVESARARGKGGALTGRYWGTRRRARCLRPDERGLVDGPDGLGRDG